MLLLSLVVLLLMAAHHSERLPLKSRQFSRLPCSSCSGFSFASDRRKFSAARKKRHDVVAPSLIPSHSVLPSASVPSTPVKYCAGHIHHLVVHDSDGRARQDDFVRVGKPKIVPVTDRQPAGAPDGYGEQGLRQRNDTSVRVRDGTRTSKSCDGGSAGTSKC